MSTAREGAMIVRLADGRVLVAGGSTVRRDRRPVSRRLATTEIYDPVADRWSAGPDLLEPRKDGHALLLRGRQRPDPRRRRQLQRPRRRAVVPRSDDLDRTGLPGVPAPRPRRRGGMLP